MEHIVNPVEKSKIPGFGLIAVTSLTSFVVLNSCLCFVESGAYGLHYIFL